MIFFDSLGRHNRCAPLPSASSHHRQSSPNTPPARSLLHSPGPLPPTEQVQPEPLVPWVDSFSSLCRSIQVCGPQAHCLRQSTIPVVSLRSTVAPALSGVVARGFGRSRLNIAHREIAASLHWAPVSRTGHGQRQAKWDLWYDQPFRPPLTGVGWLVPLRRSVARVTWPYRATARPSCQGN